VKSHRILINPIACDAYGYCAELLPEVVALDEWGYPILKGGPIPAELLSLAKRAARDCPKRAFIVSEVDDGQPLPTPLRRRVAGTRDRPAAAPGAKTGGSPIGRAAGLT
jgi:ferredoxin